jgi:hypothetical protein
VGTLIGTDASESEGKSMTDRSENRPDDATPGEDPMEQRRDDPADPRRRLPEKTPAESREPGYQDIDDRDGT